MVPLVECHPEAGAFCPPKDLRAPREAACPELAEGSRSLRRKNRALGALPCYRCSHIRNAESNCSVFTGLARYSEAPASRHFSLSPFIAFAVNAIIGSRRNAGF